MNWPAYRHIYLQHPVAELRQKRRERKQEEEEEEEEEDSENLLKNKPSQGPPFITWNFRYLKDRYS